MHRDYNATAKPKQQEKCQEAVGLQTCLDALIKHASKVTST